MAEERIFAAHDPLPADWPNAAAEYLAAGALGFSVRVNPSDATQLQVPAGTDLGQGTGNGRVSLPVQGRWRWIDASISSAGPGGATARALDVYVTAEGNVFTPSGSGEIDSTNRAFALGIVESGATPSGVTLMRRVATATWAGSRFTDVVLLPGVGSGPTAATNGGVHAYLSTPFTLSSAVTAKVPLNVVEFDAAGWFNTSLNRYVPQRPGLYRASAIELMLDSLSDQGTLGLNIYKNGSNYRTLGQQSEGVLNKPAVSGSALLLANGTTDYFEIYATYVDGTNPTRRLASGSAGTYLDVEFAGSS